ncbi:MAG: glutathione S-transferase N-terminal domain-containing protein [Deltaproteobacteria bacterium]|nr:glutathione S-transferase N-terminal domain-containing protein [Deltaproteobacteria bacterium]
MFEIYGYLRDPFAWRARFAAEEKGIEYRWIPSDVAYPDPRAAKNNPTARSPLAIHGDLVLTEPFNIQLYIDEAFPGRPLQASSPRSRAEVRMFVASLDALSAVLQSGSGSAAFNKRSFKRMDEVFTAIDEQLKDTGAAWLDGSAPGLRDISVLPLLSELESMETSFPLTLEALSAYWQRAMLHPAFQKTNYRTAAHEGRR